MEKLDVKRLREEAVAEARKELAAAQTTKEKHYARLALQRAIRDQGGDKMPESSEKPKLCPYCHADLNETNCGH